MADKKTTILGKVSITPRGTWMQKPYERLDLVEFSGSSFISLSDENNAPLTDATKWMPVAKKGDKGDAFTYDDFTPEQLAKLKGEKGDAFIYDDFTSEQIEGLKQPATDAAQVARDAATEALNVPKIQDGYFWIYDVNQKKYIKTNSPATGKSPKAIDGIWWEYNDEIGDYVSTNISASSDYELTKPKIENVLIGDVTSHSHATQLAEVLANYVRAVAGKQLSTEDFTTALKNKLVRLENYDDAAVLASIATINQRVDTLLGGSASSAIDTFHEIEAFLAGITDVQTLTGLLADLKTEVTALIPTKTSQLTNDNNTVKDANYQHTDNNYTNAEKAKLAKINFVPTLDHEPGEADLTYTDDQGQHTFLIGNQVRLFDSEKGEYVFWQLYDITVDNKAVWKKAGSGGDMNLTEKLTISLTSNQAQPDAKLNGLVVHVRYGDNDTPLVWNGTAMTTEIPMNMTYTIEYPALAGYAVPETEEYIALAGNTRTVNASYNTTILTINVSSNQVDKSDLNNLQITLSGSISKILSYSGEALSVKVPTGQSVTVTPMQIEGYSNVNPITKTPIASTDSVSFLYNTELVTVNLSADNSASVAGQTITIKNKASQAVIATATGSTLVKKIPFGVTYVVNVNDKSGFNSPSEKEYTSAQVTRVVNMVYEEIKANYITIDQTVSDPTTMISGDVNGIIIQSIRKNSYCCLGKFTASGKMTICRLKSDDRTKYSDGTSANLTGTEGDVFMRLPQFYYKATEISTDVWKVGFALQKLDSTWKEWEGKDLIGVYEAYVLSSKLHSYSGVASTGNVSQANFKTYARSRGTGYTLVKHKHQNIMAFLFYAMYGNTNAQAICGIGTNSYQKNTGETNALGMTDTQAATNGNTMSINFWGLENWWGNKYEWEDNVLENPIADNGLWRITEDDGSTRDVQGATGSGYPKKMIIGEHLDTIVKEYGASDTTGFCDYQYTSGNGTTRVVRRSYNYSSADGGLVYAYAYYDSSYTSAYIGSRLAFKGEITEASSVAAFKAIAITNAGSSGCCVPGYSNIVVDEYGGTKKAEELSIGDTILGFNFETQQEEKATITAISKPMRDNKVTIRTQSGIVIEATNDHPFWTNIGWACLEPENSKYEVGTELKKLTIGLEIQLNTGEKDFIDSIEKTIIPETMEMYDFSTSLENFYTSLSKGKGALCHNIACPS